MNEHESFLLVQRGRTVDQAVGRWDQRLPQTHISKIEKEKKYSDRE